MCEVKRSPARQTWWVVYGTALLAVRNTKKEAQEVCMSLNRKYGQALQAL